MAINQSIPTFQDLLNKSKEPFKVKSLEPVMTAANQSMGSPTPEPNQSFPLQSLQVGTPQTQTTTTSPISTPTAAIASTTAQGEPPEERITVYKGGKERNIPSYLLESFKRAGFSTDQPVTEGARPITEAPQMIGEVGAVTEEVDPVASLITKAYRQQFGDSLTDAEIDYLVKQQIEATKAPSVDEFKSSQDEILKQISENVAAQKAFMDEERARRDQRTSQILSEVEARERAAAARDIEEARRQGEVRTSTEERLLGSRGNLTSAVGAERLRDISVQVENTVGAINARADAAVALERARLEGADEKAIAALSAQYQNAYLAEQEALLAAETSLQEQKLAAQQAGDAARQQLIQNAMDQLTAQKVQSKANAALTKQINDGYIYDELGQRITDAEGKFLTYDTQEDLDLIKVSPGTSLYDPNTGKFIGTAPEEDKLLTPTEAEKLGVPYGTTRSQAAQQLGGDTTIGKAKLGDIEKAETIYDLADKLLSDPALPGATGPFGQFIPSPRTLTGETFDFRADLDRLKNLLTLDNLGLMKGVLSETDVQILSSAATSLKPGLTTQRIKEELESIKKKGVEGLFNAAGFDDVTFDQALQQGSLDEIYNAAQSAIEAQKQEALRLGGSEPFNNDQSTSVKGSQSTPIPGLGQVTSVGSPLWKWGLDIDLKKGDPVPSVTSGTVVFAGQQGGFGNRVGVRTPSGNIVYYSHLDGIDVREGDQIRAGQVVGKGGNTGSTIPMGGGDGSHLDLTVQLADGSYLDPQEILTRLA